ncbi:hypothetical protein GIB67_028577 [Kingdonia uniflora]|uniref:Uncharacterized protein n=1 Tax=Kingdonia uniflora TaxID=39325 RepID=A0A7J7NV16_9MAGN|nr:hypothetical protein GIB67_028577 [Kingdonia uniflora]
MSIYLSTAMFICYVHLFFHCYVHLPVHLLCPLLCLLLDLYIHLSILWECRHLSNRSIYILYIVLNIIRSTMTKYYRV